MNQEYLIKHFSYREYPYDTCYYINLIFEPLDPSFITWSKNESSDYNLISVIREDCLEKYKNSLSNIEITHELDFSALDPFFIKGFDIQNNILLRLSKPFDNIYRYCEVFEKNSIVEACIEKLETLSKEPSSHTELISVLKTLEFWWY